jgi:hypothetical protein
MRQRVWSKKRERQYDHIKHGLMQRGRSEDTAQEIAARTVNKEHGPWGEARERSRTSVREVSSGRRDGLRSHKGPGGLTYGQLYAEARRRGVRGRSNMNKPELEQALGRRDWGNLRGQTGVQRDRSGGSER